jgi:hypothetical protein
MTSNQMMKMRERIENQKAKSRRALARVLWEKRKYKTRPAFTSIMSYLDGCETELRVSIWNLEDLLEMLKAMEDFNAYA